MFNQSALGDLDIGLLEAEAVADETLSVGYLWLEGPPLVVQLLVRRASCVET